MICPVCSTPYPCAHSRTSLVAKTETERLSSPAVEARGRAEQAQWRQEVASRVRQHRARRRRYDSNASLELDFPAEAPLTIASSVAEPPAPELVETPDETDVSSDYPISPAMVQPSPRKIIRFPRAAAAELEVELAEPALETPRILDAPEAEQMELLPSFADIRLEEAPPENRFTEELDLLPQPASLSRRAGSGLVDGAIVLAALGMFAGLFAAILSGLAASAPPSRPAALCALAAGATLWVLFQYLFLVHGSGTPGMNAAKLKLLTFDGRQPSLLARCSRALATTLSGLSLGLGYFWALVDEHALGWHDRISQTYLKSSTQQSAVSTQPM